MKDLGDEMVNSMDKTWHGSPPLFRVVAYALAAATTLILFRKQIPWYELKRNYSITATSSAGDESMAAQVCPVRQPA